MNKNHKYIAWALIILASIAVLAWYLFSHNIPVLQPRGTIGHQERNLIIVGLLLATLVVIPVYVMAIAIAWKYRASNTQARYTPDWDGNRLIEFTWWAIPGAIILLLSVITWNSAHALDPFKPLSSLNKPLTIQVVSLDWKWLFIYPQQGVASVNFLQIPVNVPISFEVTSDTVMNSFWIPALGGQIYAMPGMNTQVHLMASQPGSFNGSSANISGRGFAGMTFIAKAGPAAAFDQWVQQVKKSSSQLDLAAYDKLAAPSQNNPAAYYSLPQSNLYDDVVLKYMAPSIREQAQLNQVSAMAGMAAQ
jgi:cytochrome o ubiquinol oxidase subunit 2